MRNFTVVARGKKYWVEEIGEDGSRQPIVSFGTEDAAKLCLRDLRRKHIVEPQMPSADSVARIS